MEKKDRILMLGIAKLVKGMDKRLKALERVKSIENDPKYDIKNLTHSVGGKESSSGRDTGFIPDNPQLEGLNETGTPVRFALGELNHVETVESLGGKPVFKLDVDIEFKVEDNGAEKVRMAIVGVLKTVIKDYNIKTIKIYGRSTK